MEQRERVKIGQITSAAGLKGEMRVYPYISEPRRFSELKELYVEEETHAIVGVRYMKNMVVLSLSGICDRTAAEAQKGKNLYLDREDLWDMGEDAYLVDDLIGVKIFTEDGRAVGVLTDVLQNSSQDLYEIEKEGGGRFLLPAVKEFIRRVDLENRTMTVKLIEGLTEL